MRSALGFTWPGPRPSAAASFVPTDIANCAAWFDASNAGSITESSGAVSQWDDLSGNGRHATQATGSAQPITGTRTQNGLNVLDFVSTDWLTCALAGNPANETVFVVALIDSLAALRTLLCGDANGSRHFFVTTGGKQELTRYVTAGIGTGTATASTATAYVFAMKRVNAGAWEFRRNGSADGSGTSAESYAAASNTIIGKGGTDVFFPHDGWIAEIVVYDSVLDSTDTGTVEDYLNDKWAVY